MSIQTNPADRAKEKLVHWFGNATGCIGDPSEIESIVDDIIEAARSPVVTGMSWGGFPAPKPMPTLIDDQAREIQILRKQRDEYKAKAEQCPLCGARHRVVKEFAECAEKYANWWKGKSEHPGVKEPCAS